MLAITLKKGRGVLDILPVLLYLCRGRPYGQRLLYPLLTTLLKSSCDSDHHSFSYEILILLSLHHTWKKVGILATGCRRQSKKNDA